MQRVLLFVTLGAVPCYGMNNGVALTPPMGWNPWNCFGVGRTGTCKLPLPWEPGKTITSGSCHGFNESVIVEIAKAMSEKLKPAGYEYMNLDCGYSTKRRDAEGNLVVNLTQYPHGMPWLGNTIHNLGLKFGMYAGQGISQCCSKIDPDATDGSEGYYEKDASLFESWNVDYLKFDGCAGPKSSIVAMKDALSKLSRPVLYSINNGLNVTNKDNTNMWRTTPDTDNTFSSMIGTAMTNDNNSKTFGLGQRGAWNDADMLEVGNFFDGDFSDAEGRTNFALWSLMKSPLILGTDLTNMTTTTLATITAPLAISVNQDSLGEQGILRQSSCNFFKKPVKGVYATPCGTQVWTGALSKSRATAALVNMESTSQTITLTNSVLPSHRRQGSEVADRAVKWHIVDAFSGSTFCKACKLPASVHVAAHDVAFWVLTHA